MSKKNVFGLDDNLTAVLCYVLGWVSGIFFLICEKDNKVVRFHALQSVVWFGLLSAVQLVLSILSGIPLLGLIFGLATSIIVTIIMLSGILLIVMAATGRTFKMPIIGDIAWEQVHK